MKSAALRGGVLVALLLASAAPAAGQGRVEAITLEVIDRFLAALAAEDVEREKAAPEAEELDEKIRKFRECKELLEAAGEVGGRVGGLAAKAIMRSKCGATSEDGFVKDRRKLDEAPQKAALKAGKFDERTYGWLRDRIAGFLQGATDFDAAELDALNARKSALSSGLRIAPLAYGGGGDAGEGRRGRARRGGNLGNAWTTDYAWEYIGDLFEVMYVSGASIFEKPYQPGEWTRWEYQESWLPDEKRITERAFLGRTAEGGEWWRVETIEIYPGEQEGQVVADTITLESLFKPLDPEGYTRQLVRVRGKFPGQTEAQELLVPEFFGMLNLLAAFPWKPTEESIQGATKGVEKLETAAGSFDARHVVFGSGEGTIEWWLSDAAPGGWVKFSNTVPGEEEGQKDVWSLVLVGHGTGATSKLGVM